MNDKNKYLFAALSIIVAAGLWGMQGVILIPHLNNLSVIFVVFFSYALPFVLMNGFYYKEYGNFKNFSSKDIFALAMIGLFGGVIGTMAIVKALFLVNFNNLSVVILIQKTQPIFAIVMARIFLKERVNRIFYFWAAIVIIGVYFMTFGLSIPIYGKGGISIFLASLLAILAALCFASNTIFGRYLSKTIPATTITFYRYAVTSLFGFIFLISISSVGTFCSLTINDLIIFIIIAITSGPITMLFYYYGLKHVNASISSICELSLPITAIILEYLVYGGTLSFAQWCGAIIFVIGVYRITHSQIARV